MKKILIFSFLVVNLFAIPNKTENITPISTNKKGATLSKNIIVGSSGILIQNGVIIANVEAISNKKVKYLPFSKFKNSSLATPILTPKSTDKIVMYNNYNRILAISPNQNNYLEIVRKYFNKTFINPDLLVTLNSDVSELTKKDFQGFCNEYEVGLIYFNLDNDYIVDCKTFKIIETIDTNSSVKYKKPLFTTYKITDENRNYINYYKKLIKAK